MLQAQGSQGSANVLQPAQSAPVQAQGSDNVLQQGVTLQAHDSATGSQPAPAVQLQAQGSSPSSALDGSADFGGDATLQPPLSSPPSTPPRTPTSTVTNSMGIVELVDTATQTDDMLDEVGTQTDDITCVRNCGRCRLLQTRVSPSAFQ